LKGLASNEGLAVFLKERRVHVGLTQSDVAKKLGYSSPQFVSNWERGLARPPVFILRNLTKMYRVPAEQMFKALMSEVEGDLHKEFYSARRKS
jgi:transcriptional regulator with XRE-family HTH domain